MTALLKVQRLTAHRSQSERSGGTTNPIVAKIACLSLALLSCAIAAGSCGCSSSELEAPDICSVYTAVFEDFPLLGGAGGQLLVVEVASVDWTSASLLDARKRVSGHELPVDLGDDTPCPDEEAETVRIEEAKLFRAQSEALAQVPAERLLEEAESEWAEMLGFIQSRLPAITDELASSYLDANVRQAPLPYLSCPTPNSKLVTIERARLQEIFRCGWWPEFYQQFPEASGIARLSAPGFSADGRSALLYVSRTWDGLAGEGHIVVLQRRAGHWTVVGNLQLWIS
jgi:hypothetical protein